MLWIKNPSEALAGFRNTARPHPPIVQHSRRLTTRQRPRSLLLHSRYDLVARAYSSRLEAIAGAEGRTS